MIIVAQRIVLEVSGIAIFISSVEAKILQVILQKFLDPSITQILI
jgi:hypothetical protein